MCRLRATFIAVIAAVAALATLPAAAGARTGSCLVPGVDRGCNVWTGKVTMVADGDTLYVDLEGDGTRRPAHVRITGLNAMEQTVYSRKAARRRGDCHALAATRRLEQLIRKGRWRVRVFAQDRASRSGRRLRRSVAVRIKGRWRDVTRRLLAEGHALWLPNKREYAWNRDYSVLAQRAARLGRGIWNPATCAPGPSQDVPIRLWVNADADGQDAGNVNGEWIRVQNGSPVAHLPLGGWWVRDSDLRRYTFPSWATVAPGETVTVRVGEGRATWNEFFWGLPRPAFDNATDGPEALGDGAYLFDPDGDLRAHMMYPCRHACTDPNVGAIQIDVQERGREHVALRNVAAHPVDLRPYRLSSDPYAYTFSGDTVLNPGEQLRISVEGDPAADTRLDKHWGETGSILNNSGDVVRLATYTGIEIACRAYGRSSC